MSANGAVSLMRLFLEVDMVVLLTVQPAQVRLHFSTAVTLVSIRQRPQNCSVLAN